MILWGRLTLEWLDTSLLVIWTTMLSFVSAAFLATLVKKEIPQEIVITAFSCSFMVISAVRVLHYRERTGWIMPAAVGVSVAINHFFNVKMQIGWIWGGIINGFLLSIVAAFVPTIGYIWEYIKPIPRVSKRNFQWAQQGQ